jgi:hypothetical protein
MGLANPGLTPPSAGLVTLVGSQRRPCPVMVQELTAVRQPRFNEVQARLKARGDRLRIGALAWRPRPTPPGAAARPPRGFAHSAMRHARAQYGHAASRQCVSRPRHAPRPCVASQHGPAGACRGPGRPVLTANRTRQFSREAPGSFRAAARGRRTAGRVLEPSRRRVAAPKLAAAEVGGTVNRSMFKLSRNPQDPWRAAAPKTGLRRRVAAPEPWRAAAPNLAGEPPRKSAEAMFMFKLSGCKPQHAQAVRV